MATTNYILSELRSFLCTYIHRKHSTPLGTHLSYTSNIEYIAVFLPLLVPGLSHSDSWPIAVSLRCLYNSILPAQNLTSITHRKKKHIYLHDVFLHCDTAISPAASPSLPKYTACGEYFFKSVARLSSTWKIEGSFPSHNQWYSEPLESDS